MGEQEGEKEGRVGVEDVSGSGSVWAGRWERKEERKKNMFDSLLKLKQKWKEKAKMKVERIGKKEVRGRYGSHVGVWAWESNMGGLAGEGRKRGKRKERKNKIKNII